MAVFYAYLGETCDLKPVPLMPGRGGGESSELYMNFIGGLRLLSNFLGKR